MKQTIVAVLGPTNTGKTYRAIERMLELKSGVMGFPLRLLAREVYERVARRVGEAEVALVTGEEKRIPERPRYWIATVEAMPVDKDVDFVAVDEIQLAAHRDRGHVFTDRLLHARGKVETWFLGSETIRDALTTLVPGVEVRSSPRMSTLRYAGAATLARIPKRSAVVTFSMPRVYAIAEGLRDLRGGAAVVLGALSPRARNAQVAMFQAGEVDYLVATDAIGMGLNLNIDHVGFATLTKFDGRETRPLELSEIGQIAGRAGRHTRDGTFGAVTDLEEVFARVRRAGHPKPVVFEHEAVAHIERHRFPRIEQLTWRNSDLDCTSVDALLASLDAPAPHPLLRKKDDAEDHRVLRALSTREDVVRLSTTEEATELLMRVAAVPDYQKLLFEDHVETLAELYKSLVASDRSLDASSVAEKLEVIALPSPVIRHLVGKLAETRFWTYVLHQGWVDDAGAIRDQAEEVEERLSDALHRALRERFVTRRKRKGRLPPPNPGPFAVLGGRLAPSDEKTVAERIALARSEQLSIAGDAGVRYDRAVVGRLIPGKAITTPDVTLLVDASPTERHRAERRLVAFARDVAREIAPDVVADSSRLSSAASYFSHALSLGLSTAWTSEVAELLAQMPDEELELFRAKGYVFGDTVIFRSKSLRLAMLEKRLALVRAAYQWDGGFPMGETYSLAVDESLDSAAYLALGYPVVGRRALRADVLERVKKRAAIDADDESNYFAGQLGMAPHEAGEVVREVRAIG